MAPRNHAPSTQFGAGAVACAIGAIADVAPGWSVELHEASHGETTLLLMPAAAHDAIGPTFVLHDREGTVRLDQYQWDTYSELGAYSSLDDAMRDVRRRLAALATPPSMLRH